MKIRWYFLALPVVALTGWLMAQAPQSAGGDMTEQALIDGFRQTEVSSVSDALEQLYQQQNFMSRDMRPLAKTKFAGPAVTVLLKKEEHKEGSAASQGMMDAIDNAKPGSVYVMSLPDGLDYAGIGGLMVTAMRYRGLAGAVVDGSVRDLPQIGRLQFPVFSRGVTPATTIGHYRVVGVNIPVVCAGAKVNPGDIITADEDGVVAVPRARAAEVLKKAISLDETEHKMYPFIETFKSLKKAVEQFGRI